jgi:hypothetical protein
MKDKRVEEKRVVDRNRNVPETDFVEVVVNNGPGVRIVKEVMVQISLGLPVLAERDLEDA